MPIAIVMLPDHPVPAILHEDSDIDLANRVGHLSAAPCTLREDAARLWLLSLPAPSGWFNSIGDARTHIEDWVNAQHEDGS